MRAGSVALMSDLAASPAAPDIAAILSTRGLLTGAALERIHRLEAESGERIDHIARKLGLVSDRDLAGAYATLLGTGVVVPAEFPATPLATDRLQPVWLRHARVIPLTETATKLTVAMAAPLDAVALRALRFAVDKQVVPRPALPAEIEAALARLYGEEGAGAEAMRV